MTLSIQKYERALMPAGLGLAVLAVTFLFVSILNYCSGDISKVAVAPALAVCLLMAAVLGWLIWHSKLEPEKVFLLLAVPMGVALALW